jgi:hypothetical protein
MLFWSGRLNFIMKGKTETQVIRQIFEDGCTQREIEKILFEVKRFKDGNGLRRDVREMGSDLHSLSIRIQEKTGLQKRAAGVLASRLYFMGKSEAGRIRQLSIGITHATLISADFLCPYGDHWALDGKRFAIKAGVKVGWFRRFHPGEQFDCGCSSKPILPY